MVNPGDLGYYREVMGMKNRSTDSVSTLVSQPSSSALEGLSEDPNSIKFECRASVKVKLMCSHGGRIMPRPHDNQLRYVGGETRILVVPRDISFADLMSKLCSLCGKVVVVKYQLPNEDLDVLVSVLCAEDLDNMMEEFDGLESRDPSSRLRLFLFPSKEHTTADPLDDSRNAEQRFLDAVNGLCSVSKSTSSSSTTKHMPDFLFGLDSLATRELNPIVAPLLASVSHVSLPAVANVLVEHQPSPQIEQITLSPSNSDLNEKQLIKESTDNSTLHVLPSGDSKEPEALSSPHDLEVNQPALTYVPLVEIPQEDLPKGVVLRQFSVESSRQDSLDLSGPRDISVYNSTLGPSTLQFQTGGLSDSNDLTLLSAIDEVDSNVSKGSNEGAESCRQPEASSKFSTDRLVDEHEPEDKNQGYPAFTNPETGSDFTDKQITVEIHEEGSVMQSSLPFPVPDLKPVKQDVEYKPVPNFEDIQNVNFQKPSTLQVSSEQEQEQPVPSVIVESLQEGQNIYQQQQGHKNDRPIFMQRRASDPAMLQPHYQQNFPIHFVSGDRPNVTAHWPVEDKPQHLYEGVSVLPKAPGLVARPGLVQGSTESITCIATAPAAVRISDNFALHYANLPSHAAQLQRQSASNVVYLDQLLLRPQHQVKGVPSRDQTASQSLHGNHPSARLRDQLSSGFQEHVATVQERASRPVQSFRQQFGYQIEPAFEHGTPELYDPTPEQVHYVEKMSMVKLSTN